MARRVPEPFQLNVSDELLRITRTKLEAARFPDELSDVGWEDGTPTTEVKKVTDFWLTSYDWKVEEKRINAEMPQFKLKIPVTDWGQIDLHFVHKRSGRQDAIPLLFIHGCKFSRFFVNLFQGPGHFLEVRKILPLLTEPQNSSLPAFHVVYVPLVSHG